MVPTLTCGLSRSNFSFATLRSEEHTSELQSRLHLVCRLLLERYGDHRDLHSFPTRRSSDLTLLLLGSVVDLLEGLDLGPSDLGREHLGDRRGQRRLAVVDVTDGADVDVRLVALELLLRHFEIGRAHV